MHERPAWAEVELDAIAHNIRELRRIIQPHARIMAIVKANAYGHGAVPVSKTALENGASYLGVAILGEAAELRDAGIDAPILVLGYTPKELVDEAVKLDVTQTVYTVEMAGYISEAAVRSGKVAKIHLKIDTGMTRLGFIPGPDTIEEIERVAALPGIKIEGIYTHFSVSDTVDKSFTRQQLGLFQDLCASLDQRGIHIPLKHTANSAAVIDMPETHLDMVRLGIALYGLQPSPEVDITKLSLKPALSLKCRIAHLKKVPENTPISYGRTYITKTKATIATLPLGYADGYTRRLSSRAEVLIRGQRAPVVGTICMDQFMIDVEHIPGVTLGDEVVLIGRQGEAEIPADELAKILGTINYEIVCMLSYRIPRKYV